MAKLRYPIISSVYYTHNNFYKLMHKFLAPFAYIEMRLD